MMTRIAVMLTMLSPFLSVVALLLLAEWRERARAAAAARQIRLTDAIAAELGAVVAPVVTRGYGGPWRVRIAVPLGRPATVARVLAITHRVVERMTGRYEIVLVPQEALARPEVPTIEERRLRVA